MIVIESEPMEEDSPPGWRGRLTPHQTRSFDKSEVTVGRSPQADFFLDSDRISRLAVRIVMDGGAMVLHDISENGSVINGVHGWGARPIREGDDIRIGPYRLTVRLTGVEPARA